MKNGRPFLFGLGVASEKDIHVITDILVEAAGIKLISETEMTALGPQNLNIWSLTSQNR